MSNPLSTGLAEITSDIITNVDDSINDAFEEILLAEKEGANVEELIEKLNPAIILYQEMIIDLEKENLIEANTKAQQCIQISSETANSAKNLGTSAAEQTRILTQRYSTIRQIGAIIVIAIGFILWAQFKTYYKKRALKMRPMVNENEP
jgi:hypothetical protein